MSRNFLCAYLLMLPWLVFAQAQVTSTAGSEIKYSKYGVVLLAEERDGKIYAVGVKGSNTQIIVANRDVRLRVFDNGSLEPIESYTIKRFRYKGNKTKLIKVVANDAGIHLLFEAADKKEDILYLVHQKVSRQGVAEEPCMIADIRDVSKHGAKFLFYNSEANKITMVYEEASTSSDHLVRTPQVSLFDENFKPIWNGQISTPFRGGLFVPVQMDVSESGELFILGFSMARGEEIRQAQKTSSYGIVRIFKDEKPRTYSFGNKNKVIHGLAIKADYEGDLLVVGYYSDTDDAPVKGSVFGMLEQQTLKEKRMKIRKFDDEVFDYFQPDDRSNLQKELGKIFQARYKPAFQGMEYMKYQDFIPHPEGGVIVVAERQYDSKDLRDGSVARYSYLYHEEIAVFYLNNTGSLKWLRVVPKTQITTSNVLVSYYLHESDDGIQLLFNDHPDNRELRANNEPIEPLQERWKWKSEAVCAGVEWDGTVSYSRLGSHEDEDSLLYMNFISSTGTNSAVAFLFKGFKFWLEKYEFN